MPLGRGLWLRGLSRHGAASRSWFSSSHLTTSLAYAAASTTALCIGAVLLVPPSHSANPQETHGPTATDHSSIADIIARGTLLSPHSFDWDRALNIPERNPSPGSPNVEYEQSTPALSASGQVLLPVSPLFLAALESLAQCVAFSFMYLVARHKAQHTASAASVTKDTTHLHPRPNVFSLLASPIHALIVSCSAYALAAVARAQSAPVTPILVVRLVGLVLGFSSVGAMFAMVPARRQAFLGGASAVGAVAMATAGIVGIPWLSQVDVAKAPPLGITVMAMVSAVGPWISHEMSRHAEKDFKFVDDNQQGWMATRAKQRLLASFLLFNAATAYDDSRIVSHTLFTLPTMAFLAASSLASALSARIYHKRDNSPASIRMLSTLSDGFAAEMARDLFLLLVVNWIPRNTSLSSLDWAPSSLKVFYGAVSLLSIALMSTHASVVPGMVSGRVSRSEKVPTPSCILNDDDAQDDNNQELLNEALPTTGKEVHSYAAAPWSLQGFNLANRMIRSLLVLGALLVLFIGLGHIEPAPQQVLSPVTDSSLAPTADTSTPRTDHELESSPQSDPRYNITLTLIVDRSLPAPIGAKNRTARPFLITATSESLVSSSLDTTSNNTSMRWTAPFHRRGNPVTIQRSATACYTFGQLPDLDYRVVWVAEDDPEAMHGKRTFLMESFKRVCGKYPIIMYGEPNRLDRTMHRKWFKQMSYLYTTAPNTTKWFIQGDDDTFWFPDVLMAHLRSLDVDPLVDSVYLGDICESVRQVRALAARIAANYQYCIKVREQDFVGDIMMMQCIEDLTRVDGKGKKVTLTRLDLMDWDWAKGAREYLSLHMSQVAPATLHHIEYMRPLFGGTPNKFMAVHDLWHMMTPIPIRLRFRRFMVNVVGAGTAVITFGYHVRVYDKRLPLGIEHHVDFDSNLSRDPEWLKIEVPLDDDKYAGTTEEQWPERRLDYRDFWIYEYDAERDTLVYIHEETRDKFALTCTTADGVKVGTIRTMCGSVEEVTDFGEDAEMLESFLEK
ncbi:hypothetical protein BCR44DRAFT_1434946 [Catenaria anguillulae PL171]|uniref:Uncharacterized protein n=1 Tax=Catenaria anguillulae PL171 TaxID=765915 RepID=A0A1Y2HKA1_9FUNG|nr:hypothetical protein BCR44DRAFT_1434946 [Catenaria anguillulae PL171]